MVMSTRYRQAPKTFITKSDWYTEVQAYLPNFMQLKSKTESIDLEYVEKQAKSFKVTTIALGVVSLLG